MDPEKEPGRVACELENEDPVLVEPIDPELKFDPNDTTRLPS